jgi:SAM-dependent methyltransferase
MSGPTLSPGTGEAPAMKVLKRKTQIAQARRELVAIGASAIDTVARRRLRRLKLVRRVAVGDVVKSWDVLETIRFLQRNVPSVEPILDIGAFASEVVVALHQLGYGNLTGVDLNPRLKRMPYARAIRYDTHDFMHTPYADGSFAAITSISVIEHGYDGDALFREMSRLLKPGGFFIASFDYWPEKIDTVGVDFFGMSWTIFSRADVDRMIGTARANGLEPVDVCDFDGDEKPIQCAGKDYTFGWIAFRKSREG